MFVDPFCESFLLDCIAFVCGRKNERGEGRKRFALVISVESVHEKIEGDVNRVDGIIAMRSLRLTGKSHN
jgi:hypothetical protein